MTRARRLDERHQRALTRYYAAAGAGGVAVGVHTTQFAIRGAGLYRPVLELAAITARESRRRPMALIAGVVGSTKQAVREAETARALGYDAALLSLGAMRSATNEQLLAHCRAVASVMPLFGFYLQPAVGGRVLDQDFWRSFVEIDAVVAIKIAPFNRYQTLDVVRAVVESGRRDVALYTGNDDHIVLDLAVPFRLGAGRRVMESRIVGGLLGQWAVWTRTAVRMLRALRPSRRRAASARRWLTRAAALTDANASIFDAGNGFAGCIPGIHEVLRRQGLLRGTWCLDPAERLSPGQAAAIRRVSAAYPDLTDDAFVAAHRDVWLL